MLEVIGHIVRKRSMGKHLAFADIKMETMTILTGTDGNEGTSDRPSNTSDGETIGMGMEKGSIVKTRFQRSSRYWQSCNRNQLNSIETTPTDDDNFPTKGSVLPFGARVRMSLDLAPPVITPTDGSTSDPAPKIYEVCSWDILNDPRKDAIQLAMQEQQQHKSASSSSPSLPSAGGGISYTAYLEARGQAFFQFHTDSPRHLPRHAHTSKRDKHSKHRTIKNGTDDETQQQSNNSTTSPPAPKPSGIHGDKRVKTLRAQMFATWLIEMYGTSFLKTGTGVLDVAGGKGRLSIELSVQGQIPCIWIDPFIRGKHYHQAPILSKDNASIEGKCVNDDQQSPDSAKKDTNVDSANSSTNNNSSSSSSRSYYVVNSTTNSSVQKKDYKRINKAKGPLPFHLPQYFNDHEFLQENSQHVELASILIGLHPDECTEDIVDIALKFGKPVAVVPCCVFPGLFPKRFLTKDGVERVVRVHADFIEYLLLKDSRLRLATLPFQGPNQVVYLPPSSSMALVSE